MLVAWSLGCARSQSSLKDLNALVGKGVCGPDLIRSQALRIPLKVVMGADLRQLTSRAMMCGFPVDADQSFLLARNMRAHEGTEEESLIIVDRTSGAIEVKLLHDHKIYTYTGPNGTFPPPLGWQDANGWRTAVEVPGRLQQQH